MHASCHCAILENIRTLKCSTYKRNHELQTFRAFLRRATRNHQGGGGTQGWVIVGPETRSSTIGTADASLCSRAPRPAASQDALPQPMRGGSRTTRYRG